VAAYCSHCGAELAGRFCAKCGSPAPNAPEPEIPRPSPPPPPPPQPPPANFSVPAMPGLQENVAAALCYLVPILTGVLFLFLEPYDRNKNVRFHAFQAIFFWIGIFLADAVLGLVFGTIMGGPNSYELMNLISTIYKLGFLALWLVLMYRAYNKQSWVLPVVGEIAQKLA
jgi:uncharacterized membrane protein